MLPSKKSLFYLLLIVAAIGVTVVNGAIYFNNKGSHPVGPDQQQAAAVVTDLERKYNRLAIQHADPVVEDAVTLSDTATAYSLPAFFDRYIQSPRIIFRYSDIGCTPCVDSSLSVLRAIGDQIGHEQILIVPSYENRRNLLIWKRVNKFDFTILNAPSGKVLPAVDAYNIPYFFVLTPKSMTAHQLFFPMKENTSRTADYLQAVVGRYIKQPNQ
ncbi:hypothetical protein [Paraflavitalea pollutisoli]|uniref:hypothetical protein n=1 Tax=Paraflavitalea pollutisoli TaxID=3034143 RepID=UPI0023ECA4FB|nr:hypothetical protein [Paraflavitalea sp. H1-2-19X]